MPTNRSVEWDIVYWRFLAIVQESAIFSGLRAKNKLSKLWRAVLISTNNSVPFAVYDVAKAW